MHILGLDIHGVIDSSPEFFIGITEWLKKEHNMSIVIVSGPPTEQIIKELDALHFVKGRNFDKMFSIVDYLKSKNTKMWQDTRGRWWANEDDWWSSKSKICSANNVDAHVDDKLEYAPWFNATKTRFCIWEGHRINEYGPEVFDYWRCTWLLEGSE